MSFGNSAFCLEEIILTKENIERLKPIEKTCYNAKLLLGREDLSQSQCIRTGNVFQDTVEAIAKANGSNVYEEKFYDIHRNRKNSALKTKGKKDLDILFEYKNVLYYFECKINLTLDSEKSKVTDQKIQKVVDFLKTEDNFKNKKIVAGICTSWFSECYPVNLKTKIFYMKDFFNIFNLKYEEKDYYDLWHKLGERI